MNRLLPKCEVKRTRPDAVIPSKAHATDSGYDLHLVALIEKRGLIEVYSTGLKLAPEHGYYFDMVVRSSLQKKGYMLANQVGVIDNTYRGEIIVCLYKFDPTAPDLELPCKAVQLIPREILSLKMKEVDELDNTDRGQGGFGSTDVEKLPAEVQAEIKQEMYNGQE